MALFLTSLGAIQNDSATKYPAIATGAATGYLGYTYGGYYWLPFILWVAPAALAGGFIAAFFAGSGGSFSTR